MSVAAIADNDGGADDQIRYPARRDEVFGLALRPGVVGRVSRRLAVKLLPDESLDVAAAEGRRDVDEPADAPAPAVFEHPPREIHVHRLKHLRVEIVEAAGAVDDLVDAAFADDGVELVDGVEGGEWHQADSVQILRLEGSPLNLYLRANRRKEALKVVSRTHGGDDLHLFAAQQRGDDQSTEVSRRARQ
jgi:hypothetical protein